MCLYFYYASKFLSFFLLVLFYFGLCVCVRAHASIFLLMRVLLEPSEVLGLFAL